MSLDVIAFVLKLRIDYAVEVSLPHVPSAGAFPLRHGSAMISPFVLMISVIHKVPKYALLCEKRPHRPPSSP